MPLARHKRDFARADRLPLLVALAVVIGVLATLAAVMLLALIHLFTNLFFFGTLSLAERSPADHAPGLWAVFVPVVGGLIVGVIARFGSSQIRGHGIPEALEAILYGKSRMSAKVAVLKPLASGIAIGSGGPFGAEGPIIMTGGALGSLLAQRLPLTAAERKTLLVAGATAGMTAVFGTPVAAVLLAVELLLFEWRPRSFLPVALACAVAGFARAAAFGTEPLFALQTAAPNATALVSCLLAGLLSGALAAGLSALLYRTEDRFAALPVHWMWWPALAGIAVGIGGLIEPRALGVGYDVIGDLLHQHLALRVVVALLVVKAAIWVIALASGTSGGVLAPLLMLGAGLGVVLSHVLPHVLPGGDATLWPLVCMAATLGATLGAPLTAIVFAFGVTHDAQALLPLLAATLTAHGFVVLTMRRSIMTEKIARRGRHVFREYGVDPLERHHVDEIMSREVQAIDGTITVRHALAQYFGASQPHRAYPVVDGQTVLGIIDRQTLQEAVEKAPGQAIRDILAPHHLHLALPLETCRQLAARLAAHGVERAAVVEDVQSRRLLGIVTRSDLLKPSASHFEDEQLRERF